MAGSLGVATLTLEADSSNLQRDMKQAEGKTTSAFSQIKTGAERALGMSLVGMFEKAGQAALQFGADSINAASDAQESWSKFGVVFGETAALVEYNLEQISAQTGLSTNSLAGMASQLGDTLKPMGFTTSAAGDLSVQLVQLAGDLASFNNMSMDEALRRLQGTLIGSHENALAFGVVINENTLKAEMAANGWDKLTGAQLEQAKVQARINLLMRGTTDAQGDLIRTQDGYANQQRILQDALLDLKVAIGDELLPVMADFTASSVDMVKGVTDLIGPFKRLNEFLDDTVIKFHPLFVAIKVGNTIIKEGAKAWLDFLNVSKLIHTPLDEVSGVVRDGVAVSLAKATAAAEDFEAAQMAMAETADQIATAALQRQADATTYQITQQAELNDKIMQSNNLLSENEAITNSANAAQRERNSVQDRFNEKLMSSVNSLDDFAAKLRETEGRYNVEINVRMSGTTLSDIRAVLGGADIGAIRGLQGRAGGSAADGFGEGDDDISSAVSEDQARRDAIRQAAEEEAGGLGDRIGVSPMMATGATLGGGMGGGGDVNIYIQGGNLNQVKTAVIQALMQQGITANNMARMAR